MHRHLRRLGAILCGALLTTACSHPPQKPAYPDGSVRVPINPPSARPHKVTDIAVPGAGSASSGAQP